MRKFNGVATIIQIPISGEAVIAVRFLNQVFDVLHQICFVLETLNESVDELKSNNNVVTFVLIWR